MLKGSASGGSPRAFLPNKKPAAGDTLYQWVGSSPFFRGWGVRSPWLTPAQSMADAPYTVIVDGAGNVTTAVGRLARATGYEAFVNCFLKF